MTAPGVSRPPPCTTSRCASQLTLPQAALLAGLVKNPTGYDPTNDMKRAKDRRDLVIRRMLELKVISLSQANAALKTPVIDLTKIRPNKLGCANSKYPFYCEYVVAQLKQNKAFGKNETEAGNYLKTAGLTIRTSLDPKIQAAAQKSINEHSKATDQAIAAITIVEPGTGLVKAMVQSRTYGNARPDVGQPERREVLRRRVRRLPERFDDEGLHHRGRDPEGLPAQLQDQLAEPDRPERQEVQHLRRDHVGSQRTPGQLHPERAGADHDPGGAEVDQHLLPAAVQQTGLCPIAKIAASWACTAQSGSLDQVVRPTLGVGYVTPVRCAARTPPSPPAACTASRG